MGDAVTAGTETRGIFVGAIRIRVHEHMAYSKALRQTRPWGGGKRGAAMEQDDTYRQ
jgi:hypothetical protein